MYDGKDVKIEILLLDHDLCLKIVWPPSKVGYLFLKRGATFLSMNEKCHSDWGFFVPPFHNRAVLTLVSVNLNVLEAA